MTIAVTPGGGFVPEINQIQSELLGGDPNPRAAILGNRKAAGDFTFAPNLETMALLCGAGIGPIVTTGAGPYTHTCKLISGSLYSFTIVEVLDTGDTKSIVSRGCVVNSIKWEVGSEGPLKCTVSFVAKATTYEDATTILAAGTTVDFTTSVSIDNAWLSTGLVSIDAAVTYVRSGSVEVNHNLKTDDFRVGGASVLFGIARGRASVSASFDVVWDTGSAAKMLAVLTTPTTPVVVTLTWTNGANSFSLSLPETYGKPSLPKIGDGELTATFSLAAAKNTAAGTSITGTTINTTAGTVYATP
jgi:hypothetical protein